MREKLCCQDAQSSPGTFQSSNRLQLTRFLVLGKNAKNAKKYKKIKKIIAPKLSIAQNSAWRHLKEEN